jgi:hypothetical protein
MKKLVWALLAGLLPVILVLSCQKEISFVRDNSLSSSNKTFSFQNTNPVEVTTPTGLKISMPANAFVNSAGTPVTTNINLQVKEILLPDAMILNRKPTMSNGLPLESGGEFYLRATSGGQELRLAPGVLINMELPKLPYNKNGMKVFNGREDPVTKEVNWIPNNNTGVRVTPRDSVSVNDPVRLMFSDSLGWINVDKFVNEPLINYTANPGNCPNIDSTALFVHLTGRNMILSIRSSNGVFFSDRLIQAQATLVALCVTNGRLYTSLVPVIMQNGQSATLHFAPMTDAELERRLKSLR